jgi:DNA-binding response OmpR family regulator
MRTVLIVEDDLMMADLLQAALEADGYFVSGIAHTVEKAIAAAKLCEPDFALVDLRLANGGDGTEVGTYLREATNARVMFSTGKIIDVALSTLEGDAVLTKPYSMTDLVSGLQIIDELSRSGQTRLSFPRGFRLTRPAII